MNSIVPRDVSIGERFLNMTRDAKNMASQFDDYLIDLPKGDIRKVLGGMDPTTQRQIRRTIGETADIIPGLNKSQALRFAKSKPVANVLRFVPGLSAGMFALDTADVVSGKDGFGNSLVDALAMIGGGTVGFITGGPVGAFTGATIGKDISDGVQGWMSGGKG